jgi:hypothetical protein
MLMQRHSVMAFGVNYLRQIVKYREEGRPITYTDLHLLLKDSAIIFHAGAEQGFLDSDVLMFISCK